MRTTRLAEALAAAVLAAAMPGSVLGQEADHSPVTEANNPLTPKITVNLQNYYTTDLFGLALAALDVSAPNGVRAYADPPETDDRIDRGDVAGRRTDRVTYVFEQPGTYRLPAVVQSWWDLDDGAARTAQEPGVEIAVQPGEATVAGMPIAGHGRRPWLAITGAVAVLLVAAVLGHRYRSTIIVRWRERREARENSEPAAFRRLCRACRAGDAAGTYRLLHFWLSRFPGRPSPASLARGHADFASRYARLERAVFARHREAWIPEDGRALARALARRRRKRRTTGSIRSSTLPVLNPPN